MINYDSFRKLNIKMRAGIENAHAEYEKRLQKMQETSLKGIHGETLVYIKTEEMEEQLALIESIYQKVTGDKKVKDTVLIDSYHSATIEGAKTTVAAVKRAFDLPKTKDDKMVVNTVNGMNYALEHTITKENILTLWELVVKNVCENESVQGKKYRSGMVRIGSISETVHIPEKPEKIEEKMDGLFMFFSKNKMDIRLAAFLIHFYFVYIHPMCDGNGRTARIMMSSYLYHNGVEKIKYLPVSKSINENLTGYYSSIKECENELMVEGKKVLDVTPFLVYMLNVFEDCLVNSIASENELNEIEYKVVERMRKNGKGAEISSMKCSKLLKISDGDAENVLNELCAKGYLNKQMINGKIVFKIV